MMSLALAATADLARAEGDSESAIIRPAPSAMPTPDWSDAGRPSAATPGQTADEQVSAESIHQSLDDQLVAGVARPRIALNIEFEFGSAKLTREGRRDLDAAGDALIRFYPDTRFELAGHTDASGPEDYNLSLSLSRAEAAKVYLIEQHGISPDRLEAQGFGETLLLPGESPDRNRRVVLELIR
jgi:outer membrane protein OmpA-like peptidoglycan-associated protein